MSTDPHARPLDAPGLTGAIACCMLWGGNAVAVKAAIPDLPPLGCAGLRFLLALPIVALVWRASRAPFRVAPGSWWMIPAHAAITVLQIGTYNWGTSHSEAGRSSVFINIHPLVVAPLAWLVLGERLGLRGLMGLGSAVAGVVVLLAEPLSTGGGLAGDLVVLGSGLIFGVQTIAQKKTFPLIPPTTLLLTQTALAAPLALGYSVLVEGPESYHASPQAIGGVIYQGLAVSGLCFTVWLVLLRRHEASRLATIAFLTPIFGVGLGNFVLGEPLKLALVAGGVLVGLGIYLVASDRTRHHAPPDIGLPGEDAP